MTFTSYISPDLYFRAEKQAKQDGITVSELILKNLPKPLPPTGRAKGAKRVSFNAPAALVNMTAESHGIDVDGLIVKAIASATIDTALTPEDYRKIADAIENDE